MMSTVHSTLPELMDGEDLIDLDAEENHDERQLEHIPDEGFEAVTRDNGQNMFTCKSCGKEYKNKNSVKSHISKSHNAKKRPMNTDHSGLSKKIQERVLRQLSE